LKSTSLCIYGFKYNESQTDTIYFYLHSALSIVNSKVSREGVLPSSEANALLLGCYD